MKRMLTKLPLLAIFSIVFLGCKKELITPIADVQPASVIEAPIRPMTANSSTTEDVETGTKTSYAIGNVTLTTGSWSLDDALIGNSTSDRKTGSQSARIRNVGSMSMNFDFTTGASAVTVDHAVYGTDGSSTWQLLVSTNGGSSYTQVGATVTSSSTTLQTASFTLNVSGNVRFKVLKVSGGTNRINIDNISVTSNIPQVPDNNNLLLGNPNNAANTTDSANNYLMDKGYYILSYNKSRGEPNWVSWHVYSNDIGSIDRLNNFRADVTLPSGWYQVNGSSYVGSGFDRGHNCPSGDRTIDSASNSATFLMTNIIPQAPYNNEQTWNNMEGYIRTQVAAGYEAFIIMGSYGVGGTGANGYATTVNSGNVVVPSNIWKVVVLLSNGNNDLSRIDTTTRVIAVNTPNNNSVSSDWKTYRTSVDAIETATGYNLLSNVSTSVQSVIEARVDNQ
jgi:endonuclease G, mitochondrial